jgi:hypothetical protein
MAYIDVQRTGLGDAGARERAPALRALPPSLPGYVSTSG